MAAGLTSPPLSIKEEIKMNDFERFYIGENPIYSLQQCKDSFEDLGLTRVSSSNRYSENLNPPMTEKTVKKPGEDGQYYFSTDLGATNHSINVAFDSLSEEQLRQLKQIQSSKSFWRLTYDNVPYKYYNVKPTGTSKLSYVPFLEDGVRKYKGEGALEFVCYEGCAHCWVDSKSEFYTDSAMTTPKKRFENIDEWKNSCGLFDSKGYSFVSEQTEMEKSNTTSNTKKYTGTVDKTTTEVGTTNTFISDECLEINLLQLGDNGKIEYNATNSIEFLNNTKIVYSLNNNSPMAKIKMDFLDNSCYFQYWSFNSSYPPIFLEDFKKDDAKRVNKIKWTIEYPKEISLSKSTKGIEPSGLMGYPYFMTPLKFPLSSFNIVEENGLYTFIGQLKVGLTFLKIPESTTGVIRVFFYNKNGRNISGYSINQQIAPMKETFDTSIDLNHEVFLEKPDYMIFDILFDKIGNYNDIKDAVLLGTLSQPITNFVEKIFSVEYLKKKVFSIDFTSSKNKDFYYIYYNNFGDKNTYPNFTIENIPSSAEKVGIYIDESFHDDLTGYITQKEKFTYIFEKTSSNYYIDNEKCLLLSSLDLKEKNYNIFTNQDIVWGDFFKIEKEKKCFIYVVFLDKNDKPIITDGNQKISIKTNYLYY